jgi:hypothetical protein
VELPVDLEELAERDPIGIEADLATFTFWRKAMFSSLLKDSGATYNSLINPSRASFLSLVVSDFDKVLFKNRACIP